MNYPRIITCPNCGNQHGAKAIHKCVMTPDTQAMARELCIELYDRFVMGGWEAKDAVGIVEEYLKEASQSDRMLPELSDTQIIALAMEKGFMISNQYGQQQPKRMPVSDHQTLIDFTKAIARIGRDK